MANKIFVVPPIEVAHAAKKEASVRPFWDEKLSVLASDAPVNERATVANEIETHIASVERQRDDLFREIERARIQLGAFTLYRERLVCFISTTTSAQRDRMRELATQDCDYDRSVLELLSDFRALSRLAASELGPNQAVAPGHNGGSEQ